MELFIDFLKFHVFSPLIASNLKNFLANTVTCCKINLLIRKFNEYSAQFIPVIILSPLKVKFFLPLNAFSHYVYHIYNISKENKHCFQGRHPNGHQVHEKILNSTNPWGNAHWNQNHLTPVKLAIFKKTRHNPC